MSYSILQSGRQHLGQAMAGYGTGSQIEKENQLVRDQMEAAEDAEQSSAIGTAAGIGAKYAIEKSGEAAVSELGAETVGSTVGSTAIEGATGSGAGAVGNAAIKVGTETAAVEAAGAAGAEAAIGAVGAEAGAGAAGAAAAGSGASGAGSAALLGGPWMWVAALIAAAAASN